MLDLNKSFISTGMHPIKVWDVSLCQEKKVEAYARKHEMEHLKYDLESSIVEHGGTIYLGIKVISRRITRIYTTSSLRWSWACDILVGMKWIMTWKSAIISRSKVMADALSNRELC